MDPSLTQEYFVTMKSSIKNLLSLTFILIFVTANKVTGLSLKFRMQCHYTFFARLSRVYMLLQHSGF